MDLKSLVLKMSKLVSSFLCLVIPLVGWSQPTREIFQKQTYSKKGSSVNFRILNPANSDATKKYPVVLYLPGVGEQGKIIYN